jgi:hypothetical protein
MQKCLLGLSENLPQMPASSHLTGFGNDRILSMAIFSSCIHGVINCAATVKEFRLSGWRPTRRIWVIAMESKWHANTANKIILLY